jgi:hypothetical protein
LIDNSVQSGADVIKQGGGIVGGSHRLVRAAGERAVLRRITVVIRLCLNCRSTI